MPEVVLIRPGATDFDEQQRIQGALDLPLNDRGQAQVNDVVDELREAGIAIIYTGPSEPALSTASAISDGLGGVKVKESDNLRNVDQGLWQGLQIEDVRRKYPKAYKQWRDFPESVCPPEGETVPDAMKRVKKVLGRALRKDKPIAVVASEPLATLIGCYITGDRSHLSSSLSGDGDTRRIEYLRIGPVNGSAKTNGDTESGSNGELHSEEQSP